MIQLKDDDLMPMGEFKDKPMREVPAERLIYYYETYPDLHSQVKDYVKRNLDVLRAQVARQKKFNSK